MKENFDRFNFEIHKEKEMVDFRRVITALAVLALFVGLASAQVNNGTGGTQLTCATNVTVTPALRGEGFTEQTGDITISCTGGALPTYNSSIPLVNFTIFYNTTVTSRLLPPSTGQSVSNASEALLLIDEPQSGLGGFGPSLNQVLCTTPATGCAAFAGFPTTPNPSQNGGTAISPVLGAVTAVGGTTPAPNVYQGVVNGNSVTFFGVPVMPPTTTGSRVFRITNVRVNAQPLAGGSASGASPVQASISISGATSLSISNSAPNVGYVSLGLSTGVSTTNQPMSQCNSQTKQAIDVLTFSENFGTAFKTRIAAQSDTAYAGQQGTTPLAPTAGNQNTPGGIYNSESNFVYPLTGTSAGFSGQVAGLADFGTRLKATFNNIPAGTHIFVSTSNVSNAITPILKPPVGSGTIGGSTGNGNNSSAAYVGYAALVSSETAPDGFASGGGFLPGVAASDNSATGSVPIAEVTIANGTGTAVWEVLNTNPNTLESLKFGVYITYAANVAQNSPAPGVSTVNLSFAPTATSGVASSSLPIPRFIGDSSAGKTILTINQCRTVLLYPYLTNQAGFDTGVTVANTTMDPFATPAQAGSCTFNWYGGTTAAPTTPPAAYNTGNIAAGATFANTLQTIAPGFQGYMIAVCNFQLAHGFAFISDVGARNLAMGYLAVVLDDPGNTGSRSSKNTNVTTAENGGH